MPRRGRGGNKDAPEQAPPAQVARQPGEDPCSSGKAAASSARKSSDSSISSGAWAHERRTHQRPPRRLPRDGLNENVFEQRTPGSIDKVDLNIAVRGICADYYDNNVSPLLWFVQQAQEQLNWQLQELRAVIGQKADANNVPSLEDFKAFKASVASPERRSASLQSPTSLDADGGVAALVGLQELPAALQRKADAGGVPTMAQFEKLSATVDQKANAKDVPALKDLGEFVADAAQNTDDTIAAKIGTFPEIGPTLQSVEKLAAALEQKASNFGTSSSCREPPLTPPPPAPWQTEASKFGATSSCGEPPQMPPPPAPWQTEASKFGTASSSLEPPQTPPPPAPCQTKDVPSACAAGSPLDRSSSRRGSVLWFFPHGDDDGEVASDPIGQQEALAEEPTAEEEFWAKVQRAKVAEIAEKQAASARAAAERALEEEKMLKKQPLILPGVEKRPGYPTDLVRAPATPNTRSVALTEVAPDNTMQSSDAGESHTEPIATTGVRQASGSAASSTGAEALGPAMPTRPVSSGAASSARVCGGVPRGSRKQQAAAIAPPAVWEADGRDLDALVRYIGELEPSAPNQSAKKKSKAPVREHGAKRTHHEKK